MMLKGMNTAVVLVLVAATLCGVGWADAGSPCRVQHPLKPPRAEFSGRCPNCGMIRAMWARTWHIYTDSRGQQQACSMHCLADRTVKSGEQPADVRVAVYLAPETMAPVTSAYYVVGASAAGTMSPQSKLAFVDRAGAERFAADCGGQVVRFAEALSAATAALPDENRMITERRLKSGKIGSPVDNQDSCPVCDMYPARYPRHRTQIRMGSAPPLHFCSTKCLFAHLSRMPATERDTAMVWVTDTPSGDWVSGLTAFYVVGSGKSGPMGYEAFAFADKAAAVAFVGSAGRGRVVAFQAVTPGLIAEGQ